MVTHRRSYALALALAFALPAHLAPATGWSQEIEEITVTARKREESLQEVPISITAFTVDGLRDRNIQSIYNLAEFTPNFSLSRNLGRRLDTPTVRGQFTPLVGTEPNAAFYVDGVFVTGSASSLNIDNLERVEILRGPQAALFGRAAFSGAVNYITRKPTNEFTGEVNLKAGEDEDYSASGWASGPIVKDKLLAFGSVSYQSFDGEWRNGLQENEVDASTNPNTSLSFFAPFTWENSQVTDCPPGYLGGCPPQNADNTKLGGEETVNLTGKLIWLPTDSVELSFKVEDISITDDHFPSIYVPPYERQYDANGDLVLNEFGFADLQSNLNCKQPVYDPANQIYIPSPGWFCGELDPDGFVSKLNLPNLRQGVTTGAGSSSLVAKPAPFLGQEEDIRRYQLQGLFDLAGGWSMTARYTEADIDQKYFRDLDRTPALGPLANGLFEAGERYSLDDKSAEIRFESPGDGKVRGLLGAFYYNRNQDFNLRNFTGFGAQEWDDGYSQEIDNYAIFGSISYDVSDTVTFDIDARYASDEIHWETNSNPADTRCDPDNPAQVAPDEPDFYCDPPQATDTYYSFTPRFTLKYQPTEELNFYGLIAEGNKPGGFNFPYFDTRAWRPDAWRALEDEAVIEEEEATTYEIGAKTSLFDNQLIFNAAFFYIDWKNQAINIAETVSFEGTNPPLNNQQTPFNVIENAGKSSVTGMELEATWAATDNLVLAATYGWAKNELKDYFDQELATLNCNTWGWEGYAANLPFSGNVTTAELDTRCQSAGDASGQAAPRVPEHSANLSANYQRPFNAELGWFFRTDLTYESKKWNTVANLAHTGEMYIWNARTGLDAASWTATFYVDNILDDDTVTLIQDFPLIDQSRYQRWDPAASLGYYVAPDTDTRAAFVNPTGFQMTPRRSRNVGVLLQYRFGN